MTVNELLRRVSSSEITEWMAFYAVEASPDEKPEVNTAQVLKAMFAHRIKRNK